MQPFEHGNIHVWQGNGIMLSNESTKQLKQFDDVDSAVNWLYVNGYQHIARKLNHHAKG